MLTKKAITRVKKPTTRGYYGRLILVPKPMKRWRPVIDLSMLNNHLYVPTFKMETAEFIRKSIQKGEWVTSIDHTDAYFHVPIHPQSQKYLRFPTKKGIFQFRALPFGVTNVHQKVISLDSKKAHVTHRNISFLRENSTTGKVTHETFPVVPEVTLEISPVLGQKDPSNREFSETSLMVGGSTESYGRCSYPSSCSQHTGIHRCLSKRLGSSLKRDSAQWPLAKQGSSASHQCTGAKSCPSGPKGSSGALTGSKSAHLFRQQHSSISSEQRRRHPFHRNVCSYLENSGIHKFQKDPDKSKTCTWIPKRDSRLPIRTRSCKQSGPFTNRYSTKFSELGTQQW